MNPVPNLYRLTLVGIAVFCLLTTLTAVGRTTQGEQPAAPPNEDDLCYVFGLVNCYYIHGCLDVGFRCVILGNECSYHPIWCPPCAET